MSDLAQRMRLRADAYAWSNTPLYVDTGILLRDGAARIAELESAITRVVTERGDRLCWRDIYAELAGLVGIEFAPELLPEAAFLANCRAFHGSLASGACYVAPVVSEEEATGLRARIAELEAEVDRFKPYAARAMHLEEIEKSFGDDE